jgi:acetyl-CoA C-acetyltransferase
MEVRRVAILGGSRIPFARSGTKYRNFSNQDMMVAVLKNMVKKFDLENKTLGDVALGAVMKHSKDFNLARECVLSSGLSPSTPAFDMQRACGTSLETAITIGNKIAVGQIDVGIAGGSDTSSDVPIVFKPEFSKRIVQASRAKSIGQQLSIWKTFNPKNMVPLLPANSEPRTGKSMGKHCEIMAQKWEIPRGDQDRLAYESHTNSHAAYAAGFYDDLVEPFGGLDKDNNIRGTTTEDKLSKLKPAFDRSDKATLTAGNSTPLTDGASAILLSSEQWAKENNHPVLAYLTFSKSAAVDFEAGEGLLMAPTVAVSNLIDQMGITLQDFDFYEIHEAFAAQTLCNLKAWESEEFCKDVLGKDKALGSIDRSKMNIKGGSVGIGHPFAATGTRLIATLAKTISEAGKGRGLISACTAGGMAVVCVVEKE